MKYIVVEFETKRTLEETVSYYLQHGWVPVGGVSIKPGTSVYNPTYVQAMMTEVWEPRNETKTLY